MVAICETLDGKRGGIFSAADICIKLFNRRTTNGILFIADKCPVVKGT
jgi:hypothetical protein